MSARPDHEEPSLAWMRTLRVLYPQCYRKPVAGYTPRGSGVAGLNVLKGHFDYRDMLPDGSIIAQEYHSCFVGKTLKV